MKKIDGYNIFKKNCLWKLKAMVITTCNYDMLTSILEREVHSILKVSGTWARFRDDLDLHHHHRGHFGLCGTKVLSPRVTAEERVPRRRGISPLESIQSVAPQIEKPYESLGGGFQSLTSGSTSSAGGLGICQVTRGSSLHFLNFSVEPGREGWAVVLAACQAIWDHGMCLTSSGRVPSLTRYGPQGSLGD